MLIGSQVNKLSQRLFTLLLTLGMLLGVVATGCSDKDRDNYKAPAETKTFAFVYEKESPKVPASAVYIQATGIGEDGQVIPESAKLATEVIDEQLNAQDGKYYAYTTVTDAVDRMIYAFYYTNDEGEKIGTQICKLDCVADIADGATVTAEETSVADVVAQCYAADDQPQDTFQVGDIFQVKVFDRTDGEEITNYVALTGYNSDVLQRIEGTQTVAFAALSDGESDFSVEYQGYIIPQVGHVVIGSAPAPTLTNLLLCPQGYYVQNNKLYTDEDVEVSDYASLPSTIADLEQGASYTFCVAGLYSDDTVQELAADSVNMTPTFDLVTVEDFKVTAKSDVTGSEMITVQNESGLISNVISFNVVEPQP